MYKAGFKSKLIKSHTIANSVYADASDASYSKINATDISKATEYQDKEVNAFLRDMPGEIIKISTTPMLTDNLFTISTTITFVKTTMEACGESQRCSEKNYPGGTCDCYNMGLITNTDKNKPNENKPNENKPDKPEMPFDRVDTTGI